MLSINLQGWNKLTDEQRHLVNKIIHEFGQNSGEAERKQIDHKEHEPLEIEHWFTGEL